MAAVGEAFLSSLFQVLFDRLFTSIPDWICGHDIKNDLKRFERKLMKIKLVLNDAEDKQFTNGAVKKWLDELKDATYDAEDVLDEFATEASQRKLEAECGRTSTNRERSWIPAPLNRSDRRFNADIESKIKAIADRFDDLAKELSELRLNEVVFGSSSMVRETSSVVDDSRVYGRDHDKEKIIEQLLKDEPKISVIPIVGMGGIGKTTLAQIVYNDPRLKKHFDLKAWTCVSDEFDVKRITKSILNSVDVVASNSDDLNQVQVKLKEALAGKKFLIVLDDVWNKKYGDWDVLQTPFRVGSPGSKIIVTTRIKDVASMMGTTIDNHYDLEYLSIDDCWSVFVEHAFDSGYIEAKPKLVEIGKKIVEKCSGLPLVAKTLGGLLRSKAEEDEWEQILNSRIWDLPEEENDILPALKLSYHHLPSHLKRCFAYCSIFPKDYEFEKVELVLLWIAEGLVQQPNGRKQMEDHLGMRYFHDLLSMSFFQPSSNNKLQFVMHDLINDLAQWVAGKTCFKLEDMLEGEEKYTISRKARHSSYIGRYYDRVKKFEAFNGFECLRTFLPLMTPQASYLTNYVPLELLPKLRCLRVLSLARYQITNLPNSIGDLKHLRYLNLSYTTIIRLPESTSNLYNLQVLNLRDCSFLMELPTRMRNLINLRLLDITNTNKIKEMPSGMGKLMSLQKLSNFIVGSNSGSGIRELMNLKHLRGTFCISRLENVLDARDVCVANLKDKQDLDVLRFKWSSTNDDSTNEVVKQVLDMLRPHNKLKELTIECYGGTMFPAWVGDPSFSNMVLLRLEECVNCTSLPSLGRLPLLKDLYIKGMNKVNTVGLDFYGEGCPKPFPLLEALYFEDLHEWERWVHSGDNGQVEAFPCLRKLSIKRCPKLLGKLPNHLPSLEEFIIYECHLLVISISSLPKLLKFNIDKCQKNRSKDKVFDKLSDKLEPYMQSLPNTIILYDIFELMRLAEGFMQGLTQVEDLTIIGCEKMTSLWQNEAGLLQNLTSLRHLKIEACMEFVSLAVEEAKQQQQQLVVPCGLESLKLYQCDNLKNLLGLHGLASLRYLTINGCHSLTSIARGHLPSTLVILEIENCNNLESLMDKEKGSSSRTTATSRSKKRRTTTSLHNKSNNNSTSLLKRLSIAGCESLKSISSGDELPVTLEDLHICECPKLESIVDSMHNNLALKRISIEDCKSLKSFPKGLHNLTHLSSMSIVACPSLVYCFPCGGLPSIKHLSILCRQVESIAEMLHHNTCIESINFWNCESLKALPEGLHNLTHLSSIVIKNCSSLISFPKGGLPATNLRELRISGCEKLEALPDRMHNLTSLQELVIKKCPGFKSFPEEGFPTNLRELIITDFNFCEKLLEWGLHKLTSLQSLSITRGCPNVVSFPEGEKGMILPTSLRQLSIYNFPNLEYLFSKGFQNLTSLEELKIVNCPRLKSFPEEGLPPSLLQLRISYCPLLQQRCNNDQGPDTPKIAYIPYVHIF